MTPVLIFGGAIAAIAAMLIARDYRQAAREDRCFADLARELGGVELIAWDTRILRPFALRALVGDSHALESLAEKAPPWVVKAADEWHALSPIGIRGVLVGDRALLVARTRAGGTRGKIVTSAGTEEPLPLEGDLPAKDARERVARLAVA